MGLSFTGLAFDIIIHAEDSTRPLPHYPFLFESIDEWPPLRQVMVIGGTILLFAITRSLLNVSNTIALTKLVQGRLVVDLRAAVYDKLQRLSFRFYDSNETGSIINRVTGDVQTVSQFISNVVIQVITLTLSLLVYVVYMLRLSPKLTAACLATTPILWYGSLVFSRTMKAAWRKNRELYDKLIMVLAENLNGMHVVKGFCLQNQQIDRFKAANLDFKKQQRWIYWRNAVFGPSINYITQINLGILLGYGGHVVFRGELAFGTGLMVFVGLLYQVSGQIQGLAQLTNQVQFALVGARRVFEVLDAPLEIQSPPNARRLKKSRGKLEFRNVTFEFTPGDPVLRDVSFTVEPGQQLGILGPTGAGKTVLLSLIPRFYEPTAGQILIDDVDICKYDLYDLRRTIGLVFQESFLFSNTMAFNIAFGSPDATREQVEAAAKLAKAHQFIAPMPKGYDTIIAEGGNNLSGGQKQRLAIARALILQPSFLLLDDPMAAVDAQTEHEMVEAMESSMAGRTTILIANRISTLRRANMILVMQKGRIVQRGTHEHLMSITGHYRETARLQIDEEARKAASATPGDSTISSLEALS